MAIDPLWQLYQMVRALNCSPFQFLISFSHFHGLTVDTSFFIILVLQKLFTISNIDDVYIVLGYC